MGSQENKTAAYGIFSMDARLDEVVRSLNAAGFESINICVFLPPGHPIADGVRNMKSASADFSAEAGFERTVSWLSAFGGVAIPGVGIFVGSREYLHALAQSDCWLESVGNGALLCELGNPRRSGRTLRSSRTPGRDFNIRQLRWLGAIGMGKRDLAPLARRRSTFPGGV